MKKVVAAVLFAIVFGLPALAQIPLPEKPQSPIAPDVYAELQRLLKAANEAFARRNYDEALEINERAIRLEPSEPVVWLNKALLLLERGAALYNATLLLKDLELRKEKKEAALKDFREALKASSRGQELVKESVPPTEPALRSGYDSNLLWSLANHARVLWLLTTEDDPSYLTAAIDAFAAYLALETDPERKLGTQLELGQMLLTNGRFHEALTEYQKILQMDSKNIDAVLGASVSLLNLGYHINDKTHIQDGLNLLARFVDLAPEKNRLKGSAQQALSYLRQVPTLPSTPNSEVGAKAPLTVGAYANSPVEINGGIVNGKAMTLPRPNYPLIARFGRVSGTVVVQVTIGQEGNIISARAISGHPLLQAVSVAAAQEAKFSPTKLAGKPVRVTGVITYNFVAQ